METSEGPPNQPWRDVYGKVAGEMDVAMAEFDAALATEMGRFDELNR